MFLRKRQFIGLSLLMVYAFFFASTNLFYHSHQYANSRIVHSHPLGSKAHTHTPGQLILLEITTNETYDEAGDAMFSLPVPESVSRMVSYEHSSSTSIWTGLPLSLRAPPVCL